MTEQEKLSLIVDLISRQTKIMEENNRKFDAVLNQMPFDHLAQHDLLREHLAHIPPPKDHGDDHEFTASMKKHVGSIVDVVVKSVGYAIVALLLLGVGAWVMENSGNAYHLKSTPEARNG